MTAACVDCGKSLSFGRRLRGHERCSTCEAAFDETQRKKHEAAEAEHNADVELYEEVLDQLRADADQDVVLDRIRLAQQLTPLPPAEVQGLNQQALSDLLAQLLDDDVITRGEDLFLAAAARTLGVAVSDAEFDRYVIASCNSGIMPRDPEPQILLNPGEFAYQRAAASVLSERVVKEYRTNFQSVSFPIGDSGIRYRAGRSRGREVIVGTKVEVADRGWLSVTSQRVVFSGSKQVMEFPLRRLVGLKVFGDGLGLQIANRKSVPTFRTDSGLIDVLVAVINTAAMIERGTFVPLAVSQSPAHPVPVLPRLLAANSEPAAQSAVTSIPEAVATASPDTANSSPDRMVPEAQAIFEQLDKMPGQHIYIEQIKARYQVGGGTRDQLVALLSRCHRLAMEAGVPPSLTPQLLTDLPIPDQPPVRELPESIRNGIDRLAGLGLTPTQVEGLQGDYRAGLMEQADLSSIERILTELAANAESSDSQSLPTESDSAAGQPAALVYGRAGAGTRTRELLDVLASCSEPLVPEEIGRRMHAQDDGTAITKSSVRAVIRNIQRIEKNLRNEQAIDRGVLIVDWSGYDVDGANRYALSPEDKATILRLA